MRCHGDDVGVVVLLWQRAVSVAKESGDEEEDETEQENKEDTAAAVLGRGHRNALLASRTRVGVMSLCCIF